MVQHTIKPSPGSGGGVLGLAAAGQKAGPDQALTDQP
jgi:hypothetical protein